jgi:hypothetical protein
MNVSYLVDTDWAIASPGGTVYPRAPGGKG